MARFDFGVAVDFHRAHTCFSACFDLSRSLSVQRHMSRFLAWMLVAKVG